MSDELKPLPCPFCGSERVTVEAGDGFRWRVAGCCDCGALASEVRCNTFMDDRAAAEAEAKQRAIEEWNRRVDDTLRTQLAAMTAERDAERAKVAALREALAGIELFFVRPGETINDKFERIGQAFHKATGMLRPGKDASMHCPHTYEEREKAFDEWCTAKAAAARNALETTK